MGNTSRVGDIITTAIVQGIHSKEDLDIQFFVFDFVIVKFQSFQFFQGPFDSPIELLTQNIFQTSFTSDRLSLNDVL